MQLLELNQDVLLHILASLDVLSVLDCSQVCWYLHGLSTSKHVWLSLLTDLNQRLLLEMPLSETLAQHTVSGLIAEVKRVVLGPTTWASDSDQQPTIRRQIRLTMDESHYGDPTLLMGDKHLIVKHRRGFEIWNVADGRREWGRDVVSHIDVKPLYHKDELVVALITLANPWHMQPPATIEVLKLDLTTHSARQILSIELPEVFSHTSRPVMSYALLGLYVEWRGRHDENRTNGTKSGILVIDWENGRFVLLPRRFIGKTSLLQNFDLIRGCLIALAETEDGAEVVIYSISWFEPHWNPISSAALHGAALITMSSRMAKIVPIIRQPIPYPVADPLSPNAIMSVYECVVCAESWIVAAYFSLWKPGDVHDLMLPRLEKSSHDSRSRLQNPIHSTRLDFPSKSHSKSTQVDSSRWSRSFLNILRRKI
ncbi:hypothetical protein B0H19DRAFT_1299900 [Mycena capillaripes]|nr:hypothetical protein B0H19DRAFT_1299900 [Mycena capillaripes]